MTTFSQSDTHLIEATPEALRFHSPDLLFYACWHAMGRLTTLPVRGEHWHVLELLTQTGAWGQKLAQYYPDLHVTSCGATPPLALASQNWHYEQASLQCDYQGYRHISGVHLDFVGHKPRWTYFDVARLTNSGRSIPAESWWGFVNLVHNLLATGGWIELVDYGPIEPYVLDPQGNTKVLHWSDPRFPLALWSVDDMEAFFLRTSRGVDVSMIPQLGEFFAEWPRCETYQFYLPVGPRGGKLGNIMKTWFHRRVKQLRTQLLAADVVEAAELNKVVAQAVNSFTQLQFRLPVYVVRAQKPDYRRKG